jgi:hypothetical protein
MFLRQGVEEDRAKGKFRREVGRWVPNRRGLLVSEMGFRNWQVSSQANTFSLRTFGVSSGSSHLLRTKAKSVRAVAQGSRASLKV